MPGRAAPAAPRGALDLVSRLLFPAPAPSYDETSFPGELLWIPKLEGAGLPSRERPCRTAPEAKIPCLFLKYTSARFVLFYLHTNAEDIGKCHSFCTCLRAQFQAHVFAVEYPGYGACPGEPEEESLTENAFAALHFVREKLEWPLDSIIVLGRSIGCGPAISLAVRYQVSGLVLISPMLSFQELCRDLVGPLARVVRERFPNKSRMQFVRSSVLVIHGRRDATVPQRHGLELFKGCKSRKLFVGPEDMGHNANMFAEAAYMVMPMLHFFALPDYCFDDVKVPGWAYDRYADLDATDGDTAPLGAKPPPLPASSPPPPPPNAPRPQGAPGASEQDEALQEGHREVVREPPQRPVVIRLPCAEEQGRTASRSRLAAISDTPSPPVPPPAPPPALVAPAPMPVPKGPCMVGCSLVGCELPCSLAEAKPRVAACCFGCQAGPEVAGAWDSGELESSRVLDPVLLGSSGWGRGL